MESLHDFLGILDEVKIALIAFTSTASVAVACAILIREMWDKLNRKK